MILHQFPDLGWLQKQAREGFSAARDPRGVMLPQAGWPTVILHTRSGQVHRDRIKGTLSVFCNLQGESRATTQEAAASIHARNFFLSNAGQEYALSIEDRAETFNIHFGEHFLNGLQDSLSLPDAQLLDMGREGAVGMMEFPNRSFWRNEAFDKAIAHLHAFSVAGSPDPLLEEELLAALAQVLLAETRQEHRNASGMRVSVATRLETQCRIHRAIDYLHSYFAHPLCLDELAGIACMSKFHFLRSFRELIGHSPYQYLSTVRIDYACYLLAYTEQPVTQIALCSGFDNEVSFARAFRRKLGHSASQYRQLSKNGKVPA